MTYSSPFAQRSALSLQQAIERAPSLAQLTRLAAVSQARLEVVRPLLPPALRPLVKAGAPDEDSWGLLAPHNAAAAKLRQLTPVLLTALARAGHPVAHIRIRVRQPVD